MSFNSEAVALGMGRMGFIHIGCIAALVNWIGLLPIGEYRLAWCTIGEQRRMARRAEGIAGKHKQAPGNDLALPRLTYNTPNMCKAHTFAVR